MEVEVEVEVEQNNNRCNCFDCLINTKNNCKKCCHNFKKFFIGSSGDYVGCVLCYGVIPALVWFIALITCGALILNFANLVAGIVLIIIAPVGALLIVFLAALWAHCYTIKHNTIHVQHPSLFSNN